ncbi:hypothetical protein Bp8pS_101 [Bacillus phage vB_BpuM-BpSp]|nr:hypothetical protein Bp8pS_101 [Bacillus phage vB_BpuM-BpSp]
MITNEECGVLFKKVINSEELEPRGIIDILSSKKEILENDKFLEEFGDKLSWNQILHYKKDITNEFIEKNEKHIFSGNSLHHNSPISIAFKHKDISEVYLEKYFTIENREPIRIVFGNTRNDKFSAKFIERHIDLIIDSVGSGLLGNFIQLYKGKITIVSLDRIIKRRPRILHTILMCVNDLPVEFLNKINKTETRWRTIENFQRMDEEFILKNLEKGKIDIDRIIVNPYIERTEKILKLEEKYILENINVEKFRHYIKSGYKGELELEYLPIKRSEKVKNVLKMYEL